MGTRHAAGARPPRTHDLDIAGGVHRLHSRAIQPHRAVAMPLTPGTPLSTDCPTSKDGIEEMANRPYRELVGALAWLALGTRSPILGTTPVAAIGISTLPQGHQSVASHAGRQVPADRCLHSCSLEKSPRRPTLNRSVSHQDRRWGRQLEVQEETLRPALVDGSGVHGALPSVKGSLYAAVIVTFSSPGVQR